MNVKYLMTIM